MFSTLTSLFLSLSSQEVDDRDEPALLLRFWRICVDLLVAFLGLCLVFEIFLRIKVKQKMAERQSKVAEHEGKLAELIADFKQVVRYAKNLVTDANDFIIPFHETSIDLLELKDLIAGSITRETDCKDGDSPLAAAAAARVDTSSSASCPHNKFMRKAEECLTLIVYAQKSLCDLLECGLDDAVALAGPIDARYARGLAEFKKEMAELESQWEIESDLDSDFGYEDLKDSRGDGGESEGNGMPSLTSAYDNKTRLVSFCDENGVVVPKPDDGKEALNPKTREEHGELLV